MVTASVVTLGAAIGFSSFAVLVYYAVANASAWTLDTAVRSRVVPAVEALHQRFDVPISVTVLSGQQIDDLKLNSGTDLVAQTPVVPGTQYLVDVTYAGKPRTVKAPTSRGVAAGPPENPTHFQDLSGRKPESRSASKISRWPPARISTPKTIWLSFTNFRD